MDKEDEFYYKLKGEMLWKVSIMNNYYNSSNKPDYRAMVYDVVASNSVEARDVVLANKDEILQYFISLKTWNGRKILAKKHARPITVSSIIRSLKSDISLCSIKGKKYFTPDGSITLHRIEDGRIIS